MPDFYSKYLEPRASPVDPPCPECGRREWYVPGVGWVACNHGLGAIPGVGQWAYRSVDHTWEWRLSDEDEWQVLTRAQARAKEAEEDAIRAAMERRRSQN